MNSGINGFGRFGLHLLRYWLERRDQACFEITYINDDVLTLQQAAAIAAGDRYAALGESKVATQGDCLVIREPGRAPHRIRYTNTPSQAIPWIGDVDLLFECSGKNTTRRSCERFLRGRTRLVIISATSWDADKTLIYGYNHHTFSVDDRVVSYGSCTVNAYVPLANFLHSRYGVEDSDVHVIHNVPEYRLAESQTLKRRECTLERSGPNLLAFLSPDRFKVMYTVVPYTGVSMLDFRFRLQKPVNTAQLVEALEGACERGELRGLYALEEVDRGPEVHNCTPYSAVFIKSALQVAGRNAYLAGYFDTENSANRYYDLANYLASLIGYSCHPSRHTASLSGGAATP